MGACRSFRRSIAEAFAASAIAVLLSFAGPIPSAFAQSVPPTPAPSASTGPAACVGCHANPSVMTSNGQTRPGLYVTLDTIGRSVHAGFTCTSCHSSLGSTMHAERDIARRSCATCHEKEAALLVDSEHGSPDEGGAPLTCATCHGNHDIANPSSEAFRLRMAAQCASCHDEMGRRFFGGNPFGMETHLGRPDVAACWDCHGSHQVHDTDDPHSPVNPANILATCRRCHVNAPPNFADIQIHVASSPIPDDPRLRIVTLYMLFLLVFTFAFFGYHTVLQIRHERRRRARERRSLEGTT